QQRGDRGVQHQREGGQLGRRERAAATLGLVDGLPAPRPVEVLAHRLAKLGERHLPGLAQAADLVADGGLDAHAHSCPEIPEILAVILYDDSEMISLTTVGVLSYRELSDF